jgi:hypothetical protein
MKNWVQVLYEHCTLHLYEHRTLHQGVHIHQLSIGCVGDKACLFIFFSSFLSIHSTIVQFHPPFLLLIQLFIFSPFLLFTVPPFTFLLLFFNSQYCYSLSRPLMNTYLYILPHTTSPSTPFPPLLPPSHRHPSVLPLFHLPPLPLFFFLRSF